MPIIANQVRIIFLYLFFYFSLINFYNAANANQNTNIESSNTSKSSENIVKSTCNCNGYADLVEKLLPTVVNISVVYTHEVTLSPIEQIFGLGIHPFNMHDIDRNQLIKKRSRSLGSGFIIDENGLVITNYHVVKNADEILITTQDKKEFTGKILKFDEHSDIAIIQIHSNQKFIAAKFGDSSKSRIGDIVIAIGNPFGLNATVTTGIISARSRQLGAISGYYDLIQTDAAINRGNSGGPMFNLAGEVIGINTAILTANNNSGNVGVAFAISSNSVSDDIIKLKKGEDIVRPYFGISYHKITKKIAEASGLKDTKIGIFVAEVMPSSPADISDIKAGDIIMSVNGKDVVFGNENNNVFNHIISKMNINDVHNISIYRHGKILHKKVKLIAKTSNINKQIEESGITVQELNQNIRKTIKIPNTISGVLVSDVSGIVRENGTIMPGNIITQIDEFKIDNIAQFSRVMKTIRGKKKKSAIFYLYKGNHLIVVASQIMK